ncbi:metal ABC transporter ATP-binding protein [Candidatus Gracilibacteria bacterium]|nr:metal ABC transporter ATP-binding protein [Candidatus Gracilibacteria bacterium]
MNKILLELKRVSLSFDKSKDSLLKELSFSVSEGEVLSIIGKNGTGKSSILKIIAGIETRYTGDMIKHTKKISYVPQKLELEKSFPITVQEFLYTFNKKIPQSAFERIKKLFDIENFFNKNMSHLSGGEFQKVLITNALLSEPELLILDEPTTGIDMVGEEQFYEIINETKKLFPKLAIILVSHNLRLVYKHSSHVICLHENNFCCHGTPAEVSQNPDIHTIFGKYLSPYEHNPHTEHHHIH